MKPTVLAVIPARANSKRIPNKNKNIFLGKPLILWSIEAAINSKSVTNVVVTTDDEEVLKFATQFPKVQFIKRPDYLALDSTPGVDPVLHLMEQSSQSYDYVLLLQPTSPLRTAEHVDQAINKLGISGKKQLVSVKAISDNLNHAVVVNSNSVKLLNKCIDNFSTIEAAKILNGAIYISKWQTLLDEKTFMGTDVELFEMDEFTSVDIDLPSDWKKAEAYASLKDKY